MVTTAEDIAVSSHPIRIPRLRIGRRADPWASFQKSRQPATGLSQNPVAGRERGAARASRVAEALRHQLEISRQRRDLAQGANAAVGRESGCKC
jgi:hypothetical protein